MKNPQILIVDDKVDVASGVALALSSLSQRISVVRSGEEAVEAMQENAPALLLTDIRMPGMSGLDLLSATKERWPDCRVILFTAFASIRSAVEATKLGAFDYLTKPFDYDELVLVVERALKDIRDEYEIRRLRAELSEKHSFEGIVSRDPRMFNVIETIKRVAPSKASVVVQGESGTGKELVVKAIHRRSDRASGPFIAFNAGAVPDGLAEAELFGARKGSYTGADRDTKGMFSAADGGTLFIDELASMPSSLQGKLLRVLQEGEVQPVGTSRPVPIDVRVITAVNEDPMRLVRDGLLRRDLYYRLSVARIFVPPLRERLDDVPLLANFFLEKCENCSGKNAFSAAAMRLLISHDWPGNVRELRNVVERAALMSAGPEIGAGDVLFEDDDLEWQPSSEEGLSYEVAKRRVLEQFQYRYVERLLRQHDGNVSAAARAAGITRAALHRILKRLELGARDVAEQEEENN